MKTWQIIGLTLIGVWAFIRFVIVPGGLSGGAAKQQLKIPFKVPMDPTGKTFV